MLINLRKSLKLYSYKKIVNLIKNSGWIFFDKIFRIATSLFVGIWIARYLGPANFGLLNYIYTLPLLFSAVAGLGLTNILFNEFIIEKNSFSLKRTLANSIIIKLIAGILSLMAVVILSAVIDNNKVIVLLVAVSGISLITQGLDVADTYFQSQRKVEYSIIPKLIVFFFTTVLRVVGLKNNYDILFFVLANSIELVLSALVTFFVAIKHLRLQIIDFKVNSEMVKYLLRHSWPLMISEIFLFLYSRVDLLMIKHLSTNEELGKYSVAMRITDLWYFIPVALTASLYPSIITLRESDYNSYLIRYRYMLTGFALISISIGIMLTITANPIVHFLYGNKYDGVASILTISIWTGLFVFLAIGTSNWFITESLQKFVLQRTIAGALINVVLNFILIPSLGAIGASIATLIAQLIVSYLINGLYTKTKEVFILQTNALLFLPKCVWTMIRKTF